MKIGAISFQPYVYNVNAVSPASMNKLSRISDNVLDKKTDFSGLVENENPLKKGQTLNFQDMLEMQMQRGRRAAARIMKPTEESQEDATQTTAAQQKEKAQVTQMPQAAAQPEETAAAAATAGTESGAQDGVSNFRMQQAISAYGMFMTA